MRGVVPRIFSSYRLYLADNGIDPGPLHLEETTKEKKRRRSPMCKERGKPDKEEWLKEAVQAYERVFGQRDRISKGGGCATFSEIEDEAVREGNQLARWLIEGKISSEAESSSCDTGECACPLCRKPAKRKGEDLGDREIHARPGAVSFKHYEWYCSSCRRSFFPSRPEAEPQS
jgi:hypothetical protein